MYSIIFLRDELLKFIKEQGFKDSTIKRYEKGINVLVRMCEQRGVEVYTPDIGLEFESDIFSPLTNKISSDRKYFRNKVIRYFNHYLEYGFFVLELPKKKRFDDEEIPFLNDGYLSFKSHILNEYQNRNTINFYLYEVYLFLKYLSLIFIRSVDDIKTSDVYSYLKTIKENRMRATLCVLKYYFKFLEKMNLYNSICSLKAVRRKKLIPYLNENECSEIWNVLKGNDISYKEKSIFLLGFTLGIRACDIINLKLSDINWDKEYITFIQEKTGNAVCLPLSPVLGNALFNYITKERKQSSYSNVFVSNYPPFKPLNDHSSCYSIVKKIIDKTNINMTDRFYGIHFLRHNVASNMVNHEIPLETVATVLGHSTPDSTNIYITTNENKLKDCVLSFALLEGDEKNG